jgi:pyridoxamine 5'-phosphate oxidase
MTWSKCAAGRGHPSSTDATDQSSESVIPFVVRHINEDWNKKRSRCCLLVRAPLIHQTPPQCRYYETVPNRTNYHKMPWSRFRLLCLTSVTTYTARPSNLVKGFATQAIISPLLVTPATATGNNFLNLLQVPSQSQRLNMSTKEEAKPEHKHTRDFKEQSGESLGLGQKSWRSLLEVSMARSRKIRGSNYVQLATVDPTTKEPRCRTVVFRGFLKVPDNHPSPKDLQLDDLSTVMKMCTDARSKKVQEASNDDDIAEVVWWFPKSNEQYRLRGKIVFVGGDEDPMEHHQIWKTARKELWGNLSDAARESFLDQNVPGQPVSREGSPPQEIPAGGRDPETGKPLPPPENFLLMLVFPHYVDYLHLQHNYRQIDQQAERQWSFEIVNA